MIYRVVLSILGEPETVVVKCEAEDSSAVADTMFEWICSGTLPLTLVTGETYFLRPESIADFEILEISPSRQDHRREWRGSSWTEMGG